MQIKIKHLTIFCRHEKKQLFNGCKIVIGYIWIPKRIRKKMAKIKANVKKEYDKLMEGERLDTITRIDRNLDKFKEKAAKFRRR